MASRDHTGEILSGIRILQKIPRPGNHDGASYKVECLNCHRIYEISYKSILHAKGDFCGSCRHVITNRKRGEDFKDKRFGSLIGIRYIKSRKTLRGNSSPYWLFKCDCGKEVILEAQTVKKRQRCCSRDCPYNPAKIDGNPKGFKALQQDVHLHNTNIQFKDYTKPQSNNKSGYPGVWYDEKWDTYRVYISFKKKRYYLGTYDNKDMAISVRKEAEDNLFKDFLDWYNERRDSNENIS